MVTATIYCQRQPTCSTVYYTYLAVQTQKYSLTCLLKCVLSVYGCIVPASGFILYSHLFQSMCKLPSLWFTYCSLWNWTTKWKATDTIFFLFFYSLCAQAAIRNNMHTTTTKQPVAVRFRKIISASLNTLYQCVTYSMLRTIIIILVINQLRKQYRQGSL